MTHAINRTYGFTAAAPAEMPQAAARLLAVRPTAYMDASLYTNAMLAVFIIYILWYVLADICEDLEMRERMLELKNEIKDQGTTQTRNLVRRRSTNTRRCAFVDVLRTSSPASH